MKELLTNGMSRGACIGALARTAALAAAVLTFTACDRQEILVYEIPKEKAFTPTSGGSSPAPAHHVHWDFVPESWQEREPSGMRVASFALSVDGRKADVSIVPLSGRFGTEAENFNRWRGELQLPPLKDNEIPQGQKVRIGEKEGALFEIAGENTTLEGKFKERTLAAMYRQDGTMWFVKLRGESDLVASEKENFVKFLAGLTLHEPGAHDEKTPEPAVAREPGQPDWTIPNGWVQVPPTAMLLAKFTADGTEITVSRFPGSVGGNLGNINRWRGQVGLKDITEADLAKETSKLETPGGEAILTDMTGSNRNGSARLVGVILPRGGETWFYKMTGPPEAVEREKTNLVKFIISAKYPNG